MGARGMRLIPTTGCDDHGDALPGVQLRARIMLGRTNYVAVWLNRGHLASNFQGFKGMASWSCDLGMTEVWMGRLLRRLVSLDWGIFCNFKKSSVAGTSLPPS